MPTSSQRYEEWYATTTGAFAFERNLELVRRLISVWPRRGSSLLGMNIGSGSYLEALWEAGFDVTGQERDPSLLEKARERLGTRADFVRSVASHLPFDDESFDYTVAVAALEFAADPEGMLKEMARLARKGMLIVFPNLFSLYSLECRFLPRLTAGKANKRAEPFRNERPECLSGEQVWFNPLKIRQSVKKILAGKSMTWSSVLLGPSRTWRPGRPVFGRLNGALPSIPLGAFVGLRVDLGPMVTGTLLPISSTKPAASATIQGG